MGPLKNNMTRFFYTPYHMPTCLFSFPILFPSLAIIWQIPRIILTHPSTSDEDVELLTQIPSREPLHESYIPDRHVHCFDSAFYPPWPQRRGAYMKDTDCYYYPALCSVKQTVGMSFLSFLSQIQLLLIVFSESFAKINLYFYYWNHRVLPVWLHRL